ncbi:MAG: hypothetical protein KC448_05490 [Yoonia sp.]|nr:hypothetical protein [Yoonia sp.]
MIAALIGAIAGGGVMLALWRVGMLSERSGLAVLLAAIAAFYPVFAAQNGNIAETLLHVAIFAAFSGLALTGFRRGAYIIAGGLIGHGVFDAGLYFLGAPGPVWWPAFCGAFDIMAGGVLIRLLQSRKVPQ